MRVRRLGDYAKKRDMLERALAIKERTYGRDHMKLATTLTNLGSAYDSLGDEAKAVEVLKRAIEIKERAFGCDHPNVAKTLLMIGACTDDKAIARDALERALVIFERTGNGSAEACRNLLQFC